MRISILGLTATALILAACGRDHTAAQLDEEAQYNGWMLTSHQQDHIRAGVIAQATIYPHHFVADRAELNELGHRDLGYLAGHFAKQDGKLNVRRAGAAEALYTARVQAVKDALGAGGVAVDRIAIADGPAGGDGLSAERALLVLTRDAKPLQSAISTRQISEPRAPSAP